MVNCHQITWHKVFQLFPPGAFLFTCRQSNMTPQRTYNSLCQLLSVTPTSAPWIRTGCCIIWERELLTCTSYSLIFTLLLYTIRCFTSFSNTDCRTKVSSLLPFCLSFSLPFILVDICGLTLLHGISGTCYIKLSNILKLLNI